MRCIPLARAVAPDQPNPDRSHEVLFRLKACG
jgi:hypothetical protein